MNERYFKDFENIAPTLQQRINMNLPTGVERQPINPNEFDILEASRLMTKNGITDFGEQARILVFM